VPNLTDAARQYIQRGWVPVALGPDPDGRPKRPLFKDWQTLHPNDERTRQQGWKRATGIGILCGPNSGNLVVIDSDDVDLAAAVFAKFARSGKPFRWAWTGRNRGHLYLREQEPSAGKVWRGIWRYQDEKKNWQEKEVHGELRCRGQQVAAPPTPGYILAAECPPQPVETVQKAWDAICLALGITPIKQEGGGNYPPAWQGQVPDGSRNNSLFVEACKLAAVRMPYERAVELLRLNVELHYEAGEKMTRYGFEATIRSAFQKAWPQRPGPATDEKRKRELR